MENFFANGRPILLLKSNKNEILFIKLCLKKVKHALNWILLMLRCTGIQAVVFSVILRAWLWAIRNQS